MSGFKMSENNLGEVIRLEAEKAVQDVVDKITQEDIDKVVKEVREEFQRGLDASGLSRTRFLISGKASKMLSDYTEMQEELAKYGKVLPDLLEGVVIKLS